MMEKKYYKEAFERIDESRKMKILEVGIEEFSSKYAAGGQMGVILNKVKNQNMNTIMELLKKYDLDVLGVAPFDENLVHNSIERDSKIVQDAIKEFYYRLNIPQVMS